MLGTLLDVVGSVLLLLGLALATIGLYGMLRKDNIFHQLHATGLVTGPAVILVLLASVATRDAATITTSVLVILFVLVTSPLSSHAIANAALQVDRRAQRRAKDEDDDDDEEESAAAEPAARGG